MKILILSLLCFSSLAAQEVSIPSGRVDTYIYNNDKDTIKLTRINLVDNSPAKPFFISCRLVRIDSIQIDSRGSKELVFCRACEGSGSAHGGTYDYTAKIKIQKYEIWNPDTKELLFEAVNEYELDYSNFSQSVHSKGINQYKYNFMLHQDGAISIYNYRDGCGNTGKPDHEEGTYRFIKGKFVKKM